MPINSPDVFNPLTKVEEVATIQGGDPFDPIGQIEDVS